MPHSCFAERLGDLIALTPAEQAALATLEERERRLKRGAILVSENDRTSEIFILKQGMMMSYLLLDDGRRQILRFIYPGDMLAMTTLAYGVSPETIMAVTEVTVCPFDRSAVGMLLSEHPRVAGAMMALDQIRRVTLTDRLAAIGRSSARSRIAALLLEMRNGLCEVGAASDCPFAPGVTQEEIGDAIGLTAVHVNRMLRQLEDEAMISREGGRYVLLDGARLKQEANYVDRYAAADLGWLPTA